MRSVVFASALALDAGCGGGTQKHEVPVKIEKNMEPWRAGLTDEQAEAVQKDKDVGDRLRDELAAKTGFAQGADAKDAIARMLAIEEKFLRGVKAGNLKKVAPWRRKLLEGKTIEDLSKDQREHPIEPPSE